MLSLKRKETYLMKTNQLVPIPSSTRGEFPLTSPGKGVNVWRYLVDDFLELGCSLSEDQKQFLIDELSFEDCSAESLEVYPSFFIDGKLVVVMNLGSVEDCWLYDAVQKRIEKYPFKRKKQG